MESQCSPTPRIRPMTKQRAGAHEIAREGAWYQTREVCHTALRSARIWSLFSTHQTARARHAVLSLDTAESSNHMRGCGREAWWAPQCSVGGTLRRSRRSHSVEEVGATNSSDSIRFDQLYPVHSSASTESRNNGNNVRRNGPRSPHKRHQPSLPTAAHVPRLARIYTILRPCTA